MKNTFLTLALLLGFGAQTANACEPNTTSRINNIYFWFEASIKNIEVESKTGVEISIENYKTGLFHTAGSFMR